MSVAPESRLLDYLKNCKIPLSKDDWIGFHKGLEDQKLETTYALWIERSRKWLQWKSKKDLDEKQVKDTLILALNQIEVLRAGLHVTDQILDEARKTGRIDAYFEKRMEEFERQEAKKKRDQKPDAPQVVKNWLEPMPVFNEVEPYGYVQATGQRRKVVENFLRKIKAKPERPLTKKQRGRPVQLYGFGTNCRVLDQWLGTEVNVNQSIQCRSPEQNLALELARALPGEHVDIADDLAIELARTLAQDGYGGRRIEDQPLSAPTMAWVLKFRQEHQERVRQENENQG